MPVLLTKSEFNELIESIDDLDGLQKEQIDLIAGTIPTSAKRIPRNLEHIEQRRLILWSQWMENEYPELKWLYAIPNGGYRHTKEASCMKLEGVKRGVPDLNLPVSRCGFSSLYIEMKVAPNKPTPEQREFLKFVIENGHAGCICYGSEEAIVIIENYLKSNSKFIKEKLFCQPVKKND